MNPAARVLLDARAVHALGMQAHHHDDAAGLREALRSFGLLEDITDAA